MGTYSDDVGHELASNLSSFLGMATPPDAWRAFSAQVANETAHGDPSTRGVRNNNPLNLRPWGTYVYQGQIGVDNDPGGPFAIFATRADGIREAARNYTNANYAGVQDAFRKGGDPFMLADAIQASPWDAGHYGGRLTSSLGNAQTVTQSSDQSAANLTKPPKVEALAFDPNVGADTPVDQYGLTETEARMAGAPADSIWSQVKDATGGGGTPLSTVPSYVVKTVTSQFATPLVIVGIVGAILLVVLLSD